MLRTSESKRMWIERASKVHSMSEMFATVKLSLRFAQTIQTSKLQENRNTL